MEKPPSSKECCEDGNMMYCNHMLPVGFIKFSLFTHSQAYFKCTHKKKVCISTQQDRGEWSQNTTDTILHFIQTHVFPSLSSFLISLMKSRLPCRDCMRQTHEQVFPPEERQSEWENDMTALPHNQTPHPQLHTTTFVWEAFHCPLYTYKL